MVGILPQTDNRPVRSASETEWKIHPLYALGYRLLLEDEMMVSMINSPSLLKFEKFAHSSRHCGNKKLIQAIPVFPVVMALK